VGDRRYVGYCVAATLIIVGLLILRPPAVEPFTREGSAQHALVGLGISVPSIIMALLSGFVQTGFCEEFFFRGLIAGSLGRRMRLLWANLLQTLIFLLPHLILLSVMPEMWWILTLVVAGSLFAGWVRIRSGSFLGPWILHGSVNVTMALSVAARTTD
jgi:membrane protease YdiL (CAAX protease family)